LGHQAVILQEVYRTPIRDFLDFYNRCKRDLRDLKDFNDLKDLITKALSTLSTFVGVMTTGRHTSINELTVAPRRADTVIGPYTFRMAPLNLLTS
jgi:hypothetical protein